VRGDRYLRAQEGDGPSPRNRRIVPLRNPAGQRRGKGRPDEHRRGADVRLPGGRVHRTAVRAPPAGEDREKGQSSWQRWWAQNSEPGATKNFGEVRVRRKDGRRFPAEIALKTIELENRPFVIATVRDLTERRRREQESLLAQEIQRAILPRGFPLIEGLDVAAEARPVGPSAAISSTSPRCGRQGAVRDRRRQRPRFRRGDTDRLGDVLPASVLANGRRFAGDPRARERDASRRDSVECFATAALVRIDPKRGVLDYCGAGHNPGWVFTDRGELRHEIRSAGLPLGMFPDMGGPGTTTIRLSAGDTVVLLTDGVLEARSGDEPFGAGRVAEVVRAHLEQRAQEIVAALYRAVSLFTNSETQADDMTVIVIKLTGEASSPADLTG